MERLWSGHPIRRVTRRGVARSADASTGRVRTSVAVVPRPGCRSVDGRCSGRVASRLAARAGELVLTDPGRDAVGERAADCGQRVAAADRGAVGPAPRAGRRPARAALPASSRWAGGPARVRPDVAAGRAGGWAVRRVAPRDPAVPAGGAARHGAAVRDPAAAVRVLEAGRPVRRGGARHPRDAGPSVRCPPGRPDPEPSAARDWRAAPAVAADGTLSRRPFRGTLPWDIAPTVRDLRAVVIARADRHPLMNLAFPQLTADTAVLERLRGIPQ